MRQIALAAAAFSALLTGAAAPAQDFDAAARVAVDRGLAYLAAQQGDNGAWKNKVGYKLYDGYYGEDFESVDVTALACMALASAGNVPGRGKYGRAMERGVNWLLSKVREEDGYITHAGSRMYSHAFATLFLAEIYGMTGRADVKPKLKRAVDLIVNSQNREGGWRYQPTPLDADLSVTVSTLQALRAARNVGITVPLETIERATAYVVRCASPRGFCYQSSFAYNQNDTRNSYALTACGIVSLFSAGRYHTREAQDGLRVLPAWRNSRRGYNGAERNNKMLHYFYGHYYAAQAMYLAGGEKWAEYYPSVKAEILGEQRSDNGSWEDDVGVNYATAMACIILQMPMEYLPIFQK